MLKMLTAHLFSLSSLRAIGVPSNKSCAYFRNSFLDKGITQPSISLPRLASCVSISSKKNLQIFQTWLQFCFPPTPTLLISSWTKLFGTLKDWAASCMGTSWDIKVYKTCFMSSSLHMSLTVFYPCISECCWCAFNLKYDNKSHKLSEAAGRMAVRRDQTRKLFETAASLKKGAFEMRYNKVTPFPERIGTQPTK